MSKKDVDVFDESNTIQSNWMKFNVPQEDLMYGTFVSKRQIKSTMKDKEGQLVWVYEFKCDYGTFHKLDEMKQIIPEPVKIEAGEYYLVSKDSIDSQMRNIAVGTKVGMKLIEIVPAKTKGYNPAKIVRVYVPKDDNGAPKMDKEFVEAQAAETGGFA